MTGLFAFLLFLSLFSIPIGLIRPSIFKRLSKKDMTRKKVINIFGIASVVLFFAFGFSIDYEDDYKNNVEVKHDDIVSVVNEEETVLAEVEDEYISEETIEEESIVPEQESVVEDVNEVIIEQVIEDNNNSSDETVYYQVVKVVDGDTIKVDINGTTETLRLIGIDTPETVHPTKPVECFGIEASNKAKETLNNKRVSLEADPTQGERDRYGRLLRYVILEDGTNFNKLMIAEGYAYEYTYSTPYKYQSEFKQAQINARDNKRGLWSDNACVEEDDVQEESEGIVLSDGYKWYVSSYYSSKQYYCETDDGWKSLSERYLKEYNSEAELLNDFPSHFLHEPCKE